MSKVVFQFLRDRASAVERELLDRWRNGQLRLSDESEFRGRLLEIDDFLGLDPESVDAFYGVERESEESSGAEVSIREAD